MENKYFYSYLSGEYGDMPGGIYAHIIGQFDTEYKDEDQIEPVMQPLIMTHDKSNHECNYHISNHDEFEVCTSSYDENVFKYISKDEFESKFNHVINLAVEYSKKEFDVIKIVKIQHPDRCSYGRLFIHDDQYGLYTGLIIDDFGDLTIVTEWDEEKIGCGEIDFYTTVSDDCELLTEISESEFLSKFNKLIEKTKSMIK